MLKALFLGAVFLISPLEMFETDADYAAQRCVSKDCTCKVRLDKMDTNPVSFNRSKSMSVYFEEDGYTISQASRAKLKRFLSENRGRYITVAGYTDGCGSKSHNSNLARSRAKTIKSEVLRNRSSAVVATRTVAEIASYHDPSSRRVDITIGSNISSWPALPDVKADVYLVDASGSMSGKYDKWMQAISISKPYLSRVYVSYSMYCHNQQQAMSIRPGGGTEIWYSYWKILNDMRPGQTLAIISDFQSRVPLSPREAATIQSIAESKSIRVIAISP